jgi:hypothetical protein
LQDSLISDDFEKLSKGDSAMLIGFDEESAFIAEAEWLAQQFGIATSRDGPSTTMAWALRIHSHWHN